MPLLQIMRSFKNQTVTELQKQTPKGKTKNFTTFLLKQTIKVTNTIYYGKKENVALLDLVTTSK